MLTRWVIWLVFLALWTWGQMLPDPAGLLRGLLSTSGGDAGGETAYRSWLLETVLSPRFWDVLHVLGYLALTVLSGWLRVPWKWRGLLLAFLLFHALATEYLQGFQPGRFATWPDAGLNYLGIALGLMMSIKWWLERRAVDLNR